jgi:hypothetical protein
MNEIASAARLCDSAWGRVRTMRASTRSRQGAGAFVAVALAWLAYTKLYFVLHPRGLTAAPSLFMHLTGRPDPFCGLTRTFAWMWRGDLWHAVLVYPVGPAVFVLILALTVYSAAVLVTGKRVDTSVPRPVLRALVAVAVLALAANWTAKLIWLGV